MKKYLSLAAFAATLFFSSCTGTTGNAGATAGDVLSSVASAMMNNAANNNVASQAPQTNVNTGSLLQNLAGGLLSNLLGASTTLSMESIAGTWNYTSPDCVFESENFLMKAGGEMAAAKIEGTIAPYLEKFGFKPGSVSYTFNTNGTYSMTINGRTINGQYTLDAENKTITMTMLAGLMKSTVHVALVGNKLSLLYDAEKLLALFKGISALGKDNSTLSTITKLFESYDGLLIGFELTK